MTGCAWVTLATNDTYCLGALVLAHSLKKVFTRHQLAIIITPLVTPSMREQLSKVFDLVQLVDVLDSQDATNLALLQRPDLGVTFTKIHCWNLTQYSKCVFLDADTLVMQNCDELMEREELSAAPDPGWPDCFNSGVFVFVPSQDTFKQLIQFAFTHGSFDGGDQGLLNMYFNEWPTSDIRKHLSFLYNMCSTSTYTYLPALKYYGANIKIVHFIGANKPWLLGPSGSGMSSFTQTWWSTFQSSVVQHLSKDMTHAITSLVETAGRFNNINPTNPQNVQTKNETVCGFNTNDDWSSNATASLRSLDNSGLAGALGSKEKSAIEEQWRKQNWEQGNIDFTGKDSFENIWQKIMDAVNKPKVEGSKSIQQVDVPPVPKEIASQAIPEKEKADIPASSETPKDEKSETKKEVPPIVPHEVKKDVAPLPMTSPPTDLPKNEEKPPTPLPAVDVQKSDAPIAIPPPMTEKVSPKLPDSTSTSGSGDTPAQPSLDSTILAPLTVEPPKSELVKPTEPPKTSQTVPMEQTKEVPIVPAQAFSALEVATKQEVSKVEQAPESADLHKIEDILKGLEQTLAEQMKDEKKESAVPVETPQDAAKPEEQKKVEEPQTQQLPQTQTEMFQSPLPDLGKPDAPLPEIPKTEIITPEVTKIEEPKTKIPEAPVTLPSESEVPTSPVLQPEAPKSPVPQPEVPTSPVPQPEVPKSPVPQPEAPKTPIVESEKTMAETPVLEAPKAEALVSEVPKPVKEDAPKPDTLEVQNTEDSKSPATEETKETATPALAISKQDESKIEAPSAAQISTEVKEGAPELTTPIQSGDIKKQKTPPKEQGKEGQKPAKQQAPQPPPKNGKHKKGQQPEPTSAHPLTEMPVQIDAGKEEQNTASQDPLSPPTSPDSQPKESEAQTKLPEVQPGTPTVIAPTPPVSPLDASKVEDPLSAQIKSEEAAATTVPTSSSGADAPVPPKRKGKGNEKQPQKPQNNGAKGKGKK